MPRRNKNARRVPMRPRRMVRRALRVAYVRLAVGVTKPHFLTTYQRISDKERALIHQIKAEVPDGQSNME